MLHKAEEIIQRTCAQWVDAGLPADAIEPTVAAMARYDVIVADDYAMRQEDAGTILRPLVDRIAAGSINLREAVAEHLAVSAAYGAVEAGSLQKRGNLIVQQAKPAVIRAAVASLGEAVGVLEDASAEFVDRVQKLAPVLEGIETAEQAQDAGPSVAKAWDRLRDLDRERAAVVRIWDALVRLEVVSAPPFGFQPGDGALRIAQAAAA